MKKPSSRPKTAARRKVLFHRVLGQTLVLASEARARYIAQAYRALAADTWGEVRRLLPKPELKRLLRFYEGNGEPLPGNAEAFSSDCVPGFSDGDYPPWLQQEMGKALPAPILQEFAVMQFSTLNGVFWEIEPGRLPELSARPEQLGYVVRDGTSIGEWR